MYEIITVDKLEGGWSLSGRKRYLVAEIGSIVT